MLHIADLNADEVKDRAASRFGATILTAAEMDNREWEAFKAKLARQSALLGDGGGDANTDLDEEEADALILALDVLREAGRPLTSFEVTRQLQRLGHLSREFTSSARAQTNALLLKLSTANLIGADQHGRWALL